MYLFREEKNAQNAAQCDNFATIKLAPANSTHTLSAHTRDVDIEIYGILRPETLVRCHSCFELMEKYTTT